MHDRLRDNQVTITEMHTSMLFPATDQVKQNGMTPSRIVSSSLDQHSLSPATTHNLANNGVRIYSKVISSESYDLVSTERRQRLNDIDSDAVAGI